MADTKWEEVLQELYICLEGCKNFSQSEMINFCVKNKITRNAAGDFLKTCKKVKLKDSTLALEKKEEGNENFRRKNYEKSLSLYTLSIFLANKNDECLSLAYSNRSVVLERMGRSLESLSDINMALACGYPKEKSEKLILRKLKCLIRLGNVEKAKEVLKDALKNSEKKEFHQLKNELKELEKLKNERNSNSENSQLPKLVGGENDNFSSASKYLSVYYDELRGRHVIATKDLDVGDVLIVEKPFAFIVFSACFNCAKNTIAPIPCWNCPDAYYCSPECRDEFWKSVHSFECGYVKLFKSIGTVCLSLRVILKASSSLDELKKILNNISQPKYERGIVMYKNNGYDSVYNLLYHTEKMAFSELFQHVMTSFLLALYLKNYTNYFPPVSKNEDLILLTSVIYRHTLQLSCNGHVIADVLQKWTDERSPLKVNSLMKGAAIYVSASMMNHSCESSISNLPLIFTQGDTCSFRRLKTFNNIFNLYVIFVVNFEELRRTFQCFQNTSVWFDIEKMGNHVEISTNPCFKDLRKIFSGYVGGEKVGNKEFEVFQGQEISFHDSWLIVRAAKAIKKGEEVFNCYGAPANLVERLTRQKTLRDLYFFECKCQRCLQEVDIQDKLTAFKCIYCKGPSILKSKISHSVTCISCGQTSELSKEMRKKLDSFYSLIKKGEALCNVDITEALKKFLQAWWIGRELFYRFHKDLAYAAEEVANCLLIMGDFRRCILFLKCCILSIEERFGSVSLQLAGELEELGNVTLKYLISDTGNSTRELVCQGLLCYQKAERIFTLLCGPNYKTLKKIKESKEILETLLSC